MDISLMGTTLQICRSNKPPVQNSEKMLSRKAATLRSAH